MTAVMDQEDFDNSYLASHYQVNEMFWTIQGEGGSSGQTAVFIRLQGCPVGCPWCDSKTTWLQGGTRMNVQQIIDVVNSLPPSQLVIVTGGEPLLYHLDDLFIGIRKDIGREVEIHIETSGMFAYKGALLPEKFVVSPKFGYGPSLNKPHFHIDESIYQKACEGALLELKYVIDDDFHEDLPIWHGAELLQKFLEFAGVEDFDSLDVESQEDWELIRPDIFLMPEGSPPSSENVIRTLEILKRNREWIFGPRLQYAYPDIAKMEGLNNNIISKEEAFRIARDKVGIK